MPVALVMRSKAPSKKKNPARRTGRKKPVRLNRERWPATVTSGATVASANLV